MGFWSELWFEVGISPAQAVGVMIAATVMYVAFTTVLRLWGQRLFANRHGTGLAVVLVLGAVVGRSMLGPNVTLLGGLLALGMLVMLESFFGAGRRAGLFGYRRAVVIYAQGEIDQRTIRRFHLDERIIWARLRQAGITDLAHVRALILETDGSVTILRAADELDPRLLSNVRGAERILR
ncbi:YetF domain-containing protein [uncultured Tessaracoccus sp.]|uniref:YetF domain-containing protein n=1 Tax=uncultured Tessaracoccus sp. TaxID=905023 RepID=UPI0025DEA2A3|nr:YetF domain-containing protein [uncultured Tessaracoccus sp.]